MVYIQQKDIEADPLLPVEKDAVKLNELAVPKGSAWESNKDLRA